MTRSLVAALAPLTPSPEETLLLRAALLGGEESRQAWRAFEDGKWNLVRLLRDERREIRRLAPLLAYALDEAGASVDAETRTVLRSAHVREELRSREFRRLCGRFLRALEAAGVESCLIKGTALGETVYESPVHRHSHDLEVLVSPETWSTAIGALVDCGLRGPRGERRSGSVTLVHGSGLPVVARASVRGCPQLELSAREILGRAREVEVAGAGCRVPSPEDSLLLSFATAIFAPSRASRAWAADAYRLLGYHAMDWEYLRRSAIAGGLSTAAAAVIGYLARELGSDLPPDVVEALRRDAAQASPVERDAVVYAVRTAPEAGMRALLGTADSGRARLEILFRTVFPSAAYMRSSYGVETWPGLGAAYSYRIGAHLAGRFRRRAGKLLATEGPTAAAPASTVPPSRAEGRLGSVES